LHNEETVTVVVAIIAPGAMGAGVGERLTSHGVRVLTALAGRSDATVARAREAGMAAASDEEIAATDFILSILPPGEALALAQHFAPILTASNAKPVYVDCNAINPATVACVAAATTSLTPRAAADACQKPGPAGPRPAPARSAR
jgi:L-threonate 2-dehydrogenase